MKRWTSLVLAVLMLVSMFPVGGIAVAAEEPENAVTTVADDDSSITIKEGSAPLEQGLNFGGKTFTYAYYGSSWSNTNAEKHESFETQYNVNLNVSGIPTSEYSAALSSAMAGGNPYDIVFLYSFDYPSQIAANVMAPLNDYITTADLWNRTTKRGFSSSLMSSMSLNGNIYCVAGNYLQTPTILWYNKKIFSQAGYDGNQDPLALYKTGRWNWDVLYDMLTDIQDRDRGLYGINSLAPYYDHQFINSFDTDFAKLTADGRVVHNLDDKNYTLILEDDGGVKVFKKDN